MQSKPETPQRKKNEKPGREQTSTEAEGDRPSGPINSFECQVSRESGFNKSQKQENAKFPKSHFFNTNTSCWNPNLTHRKPDKYDKYDERQSAQRQKIGIPTSNNYPIKNATRSDTQPSEEKNRKEPDENREIAKTGNQITKNERLAFCIRREPKKHGM